MEEKKNKKKLNLWKDEDKDGLMNLFDYKPFNKEIKIKEPKY